MKVFVTIIAIFTLECFAQDTSRRIITDPSIARRCENMLGDRDKKIKHKNKVMELISRNRKLFQQTPPHRKSLVSNLRSNYGRLKRELRLVLSKIDRQEEGLVRRGCPIPNL
ncbi:MAG: hypothetical protein ACPGJV_04050 [Bacteriovoracaceae bacterium]